TSSFEGRTVPPTTVNRRVIRAEPPHETEATAGPTGAVSGSVHVHCARPPSATTLASPSCLAPFAYATASVQGTPARGARTLIDACFPWKTRWGMNPKRGGALFAPADPAVARATIPTTSILRITQQA